MTILALTYNYETWIDKRKTEVKSASSRNEIS
jgi:hypothetical protein